MTARAMRPILCRRSGGGGRQSWTVATRSAVAWVASSSVTSS
eukprot:CAMPEP_0183315726 /NCGR_PEP_ID=MMETSP0160_2-20130417/52678_1 /TAXON_ID=2839 ORGANISM="Odontella Sinensis, Strain Grunow 1884" /NCGR_SAMPLE_ID=MMETSP0160_2 /ASSEMBLY_ACC=CAM_ASM_000250 /LENGTH=41 /DNA_ID= /DNA_START= /DNA_END= /DNA_ORIENTATION=